MSSVGARRVLLGAALALALVSVLATRVAADDRPGSNRVVAGQVARLFVVAGFDGACRSTAAPDVGLTVQPSKGTVTFQPGVPTKVQFSLSGKFLGAEVDGIAILYRSHANAVGEDTFSIVARNASGEAATRMIRVQISHGQQSVQEPSP